MKGENALKKEVDAASVKRIETDENVGLTAEQVRERIQGGLANTPVKPPSKSVGAIIASNVFTYFNFRFIYCML